ncbi:hypothetical protein GCM10027030_06740 [Luteococcus sediminum]
MDIFELVQSVTLTEVRIVETYGAAKFPGGRVTEVEAPSEGSLDIEVHPVTWHSRIETWFRMTLTSATSEMRVGVAVIYDRDSSSEISTDLGAEFIEKVSVMTAFPYLRAQAQRIAADIQVGTIAIPVLRQGDFHVDRGELAQNREAGPPPNYG